MQQDFRRNAIQIIKVVIYIDYQIFVNSKNHVNRNIDKSYFDLILNLVLYILLKNRKRK
jgi:hypothetical protein